MKGYVKIRLESPMPERFLSLCVHNQIPVSNLKNNGIYYEMELSVKDFFRINNFRRKTQSRIVLLEKHGLPFFFYRKKKEKGIFSWMPYKHFSHVLVFSLYMGHTAGRKSL